ncbi:16S rRNA (guanine(527)-N(7))-methyltransferase RsmG [Candidatus Peregrinibacteria bacterium]|nr:16S rRNA (guanine(527)-N(7))-methyltransferase RsmG [Candidatus Peregrinibacteria bacterium]
MVPAEKEKTLRKLVEIFLEENKKLNLSAYRTEENCWIGNVLDSLAFLDMNFSHHDIRCLSILDIGIGGGFPLLPLAISLPNVQFTGIDSTRKKIDAVQRIVHAMNLNNVTLKWQRAEEHKTHYDIVLARAVAPLKKLLPLAAPLAKPDGHLVFWKSMHIDNELKESEPIQRKLGCVLIDKHVYELPEDGACPPELCEAERRWGKRQLLIFTVAAPAES